MSFVFSSNLNFEARESLVALASEGPVVCFEHLDSTATELDVLSALPKDIWGTFLAKVEFSPLYQMLRVSKSFHELANQAIRAFYCIQRKGKAYLNYTALLHELDTLMQDAAKDISDDEAKVALGNSVGYLCIKSVLESQFGYCISCAPGRLP